MINLISMECLKDKIKDSEKKIYIFGAGSLGRFVHQLCIEEGINKYIAGFCDNNEKIAGGIICEKNIYSYTEIKGNNSLLIIASKYATEIAKQLKVDNMEYYTLDVLKSEEKCKQLIPRIGEIKRGWNKLDKTIKDKVKEIEKYLEDNKSREVLKYMINWRSYKDISNFSDIYNCNQYFDDVINLNNEIFFDAGAYDGDTLKTFLYESKGQYREVICVEPDPNSFKKLQDYVSLNELNSVKTLNLGLSNHVGITSIKTEGAASVLTDAGDIEVNIDTIDNILKGKEVTFIKMDIEGFELRALQGAINSIRKYRPKLAICVYHKAEDIINIPKYIKSIHPDYKIYLRCYTHIMEEIVIYAV